MSGLSLPIASGNVIKKIHSFLQKKMKGRVFIILKISPETCENGTC
jgi:hypothetical protein